ncbi:hypothetical protein F4780DRAFT_779330 [Xylariomycetidae sp. FL0641]|nr:hypothetical protein F4780DRAFT_779330 [Xylariomycetidae sp. FL0641]
MASQGRSSGGAPPERSISSTDSEEGGVPLRFDELSLEPSASGEATPSKGPTRPTPADVLKQQDKEIQASFANMITQPAAPQAIRAPIETLHGFDETIRGPNYDWQVGLATHENVFNNPAAANAGFSFAPTAKVYTPGTLSLGYGAAANANVFNNPSAANAGFAPQGNEQFFNNAAAANSGFGFSSNAAAANSGFGFSSNAAAANSGFGFSSNDSAFNNATAANAGFNMASGGNHLPAPVMRVPNAQPHQDHRNRVCGVDAQAFYPPSACVFVANLPDHKPDSALEAAVTRVFNQFGPVFVKIRRDQKNMPFAFCQYTNEENAKLAERLAKGTVIEGRGCRTEMVKANRTYIVFNKHGFGVTIEEAKGQLHRFGAIRQIVKLDDEMAEKLGAHGGVIVEFETFDPNRDVVSAYRHHTEYSVMAFDLKKINRQRADPDREFLTKYEIDRRSVFVGGLPQGIYHLEDILRAAAAQIGEVERVHVVTKDPTREGFRPSVFAFITFARPDFAEQAVQHLSGLDIAGHLIRVERKRSNQTTRNNYSSVTPQRHSRRAPIPSAWMGPSAESGDMRTGMAARQNIRSVVDEDMAGSAAQHAANKAAQAMNSPGAEQQTGQQYQPLTTANVARVGETNTLNPSRSNFGVPRSFSWNDIPAPRGQEDISTNWQGTAPFASAEYTTSQLQPSSSEGLTVTQGQPLTPQRARGSGVGTWQTPCLQGNEGYSNMLAFYNHPGPQDADGFASGGGGNQQQAGR